MRVSLEIRGVEKVRQLLSNARTELQGGQAVEIAFANPRRNAKIAGVQADRGRDPFFLTRPDAAESVTGPLREAMDQGLRTGSWSHWTGALRRVGDAVARAIRRHIDLGLSAQRGATITATATHTRPLTPRYAAWKRKRFGAKPILRATDELYHSLRVHVRRR